MSDQIYREIMFQRCLIEKEKISLSRRQNLVTTIVEASENESGADSSGCQKGKQKRQVHEGKAESSWNQNLP